MQYGKLENGILINMPTTGVDENGCLFVIDKSNHDYAYSHGYKGIIYIDRPEDGKNYEQFVECEKDDFIYIGWKEIPFVIDEITRVSNELSDTMETVNSLLTDFIPMMLV